MQVQSAAWQTSAFGAFPGIRDRTAARTGFAQAASQAQEAAREQAYLEHLRSKYGAHFRLESVPREPEALDRIARTMHGDDVIIAPNIAGEMARDPEVAAWYEGIIDHCFATVPESKAHFAAMGLTFEPCGVVVHEDGTVTYICGGGDTPERVAQVNAINAARDAKRAAQRRARLEAAQSAAEEARRLGHERLLAQTAAVQAFVRIRSHIE